MRLINVHSLKMEEFLLEDAPAYVTLSHRWSKEEINYDDYVNDRNTGSIGYKKISELCDFVKFRSDEVYSTYGWRKPDQEIHWVWIDTCCIDKRSSAELSEAINSMWNIYLSCAYCLVHLEDVPDACNWGRFQSSDWFTRGWTLQELLAPSNLVFCTREWTTIGTKSNPEDMLKRLELTTGIVQECLMDTKRALGACAARKLSWASKRKTTRKEDKAYCLLGLLDVHMPLLYGEGEARAFLRLQEEFIRRSDDESIFAWTDSNYLGLSGMFATGPDKFEHAGNVLDMDCEDARYTVRPPYAVTNKGVQFVAGGVRAVYDERGYREIRSTEQGRLLKGWPGGESHFVLALNCQTNGENYLTVPITDFRHGLVLIVLEYMGGGIWNRLLPEPSHKDQLINLWCRGVKRQSTFLVQV